MWIFHHIMLKNKLVRLWISQVSIFTFSQNRHQYIQVFAHIFGAWRAKLKWECCFFFQHTTLQLAQNKGTKSWKMFTFNFDKNIEWQEQIINGQNWTGLMHTKWRVVLTQHRSRERFDARYFTYRIHKAPGKSNGSHCSGSWICWKKIAYHFPQQVISGRLHLFVESKSQLKTNRC